MKNKVNISAIKSKMHFIYKDEREKNIAAIVIYNKDGKFFFDPEYKNEMSNLEVEALLLRGALVDRGGKYYRPSSFNENNVSFSDAVINPEDIEVDLSGYITKDELDLSGYVTKDELNSKADKSSIPTKVSQLENDKGYLTGIPSEYITETELNNKGYLTEHQDLSHLATKSYVNNQIANAQLGGGDTGGESSQLSSMKYNVKNVKDYGATGDGETNDLAALKELFENANPYDMIYFPAGVYLLGNGDATEILLRLNEVNHVAIVGHSKEDTKIVAHPQSPVKNRMGLISIHKSHYCSIEDIELDGNSQSRYVANGGVNWGDDGTLVDDCSNIQVDGANYTIIRNVYSHHPIIDCIITSRYAGGTVPNNHHLLIEDCILDYGYRQGFSIVGTDHGIIRNCQITNTAMALDLTKNDGVSTIGTMPKAGIDSETWGWNHDWIIENCYFENNVGGHINMNDGASEHVIRKNYFVGGAGVGSETPSAGTRTINNVITQNNFYNSTLSSQHGAFTVTDNTFYFDDTTITNSNIVSMGIGEPATKRGGDIIFSSNRVSVDIEAYTTAGIELTALDFRVVLGKNCVVTNNSFNNLVSPAIVHIANAPGVSITNNRFNSCVDLQSVITPNIVIPDNAILENNTFSKNYSQKIANIYNVNQVTTNYRKNGNEYSSSITLTMIANRKYNFPLIKKSELKTLNIKLNITTDIYGTGYNLPNMSYVTYDIIVYNNGSEVIDIAKRTKHTTEESCLVKCIGIEVIDDIVYLCVINEYACRPNVSLDFTVLDSSTIMGADLNLVKYSKEDITPTVSKIAAKAYTVGEQIVDSLTGAYYYEVTTAGTVSKTKIISGFNSITVDEVVFTYKGFYEGQYHYGE